MAVNKVVYGDKTRVDLTNDSVTPDTLAEGATAHDASGAQITGTMKSGGGASVQSDWNQTDETAADFIKNKPFGDELTELMPVTEMTAVTDEGLGVPLVYLDVSLFADIPLALQVTFNGIKYECVVSAFGGAYAYGNLGLFEDMPDTGEPFLIIAALGDGFATIVVPQEGSFSAGIESIRRQKINPQFVDSSVIFYVDPNEEIAFMYTDRTLTTKATREDIISVGNRTILIDFMTNGVHVFRSSVAFLTTPEFAQMTTGYCELMIHTNQGNNVGTATLYTAEYTP